MAENPSPELSVRLLRAKTEELELMAPIFLMEPPPTPDAIGQALGSVLADIAFVASLLADHIDHHYTAEVKTVDGGDVVKKGTWGPDHPDYDEMGQ